VPDKRLFIFGLSVTPRRLLAGVAIAVLAAGGAVGYSRFTATPADPLEVSSQSRRGNGAMYVPTAAEWASLTVEPVSQKVFRAENVTEGKIAVDEDRSTPVFSPYVGRVTKLLARPGEQVVQGQPLLVIEATDTVQSQNDYVAAIAAVNKARSQLDLAQLQDRRARDLFEGKAAPLKDYQQSQATLIGAQNDMRSAETALEAARNRLRILGFTDEAVKQVEEKGRISPDTRVLAPLAGTVVQRKVGPGQYISTGATDPVFVIGDLSTVWLTAFVRETEATAVAVGQELSFSVLSSPGRTYRARVDYVAAAIDPATRRLLVRATIDNTDGSLKPEMFANVTIYSGNGRPAIGVPKQALIYEGDQVRVWVVRDDKSIELRPIKVGLSNRDLVEVKDGLSPDDRIVTRGSLFIDRAASAS
jgi:cobalt-zinc-cadmium efflux system membrane fusion protein